MYHQSVSQESDIFSKISEQERLRLFKDLATARIEIAAKGVPDEVYRFNVERTTPRNQLVCSIPFGLSAPENEKDLVCQFFIGGERYFFKALARIENEKVVLEPNSPLFHLQRRQSYRIKIPEKYPAKFLISEINKRELKLSADLYDLSSSGCRVILLASSPILQPGDQIKAHMFISNREPLEVEGTVRHHKVETYATKTTKQIFGVELNPLSSFIEGKLFSITMDLHREFFSRMKL